MNLILFEADELSTPLPHDDERAHHLRTVLRRTPGDDFDCGLVDGPRGKARIVGESAAGLHLEFTWGEPPPPLPAVALLVGLPRPQTARKILTEASALGVSAIHFFRAEKSEPSYASSHLWTSGEPHRHLRAGVAQAFCTRVPALHVHASLAPALTHADAQGAMTRLACDNYEAPVALPDAALAGPPAVLAIGSERGWSAAERDALRTAGFTLVHLGPRVLRTETACVAALAILKARLGLR